MNNYFVIADVNSKSYIVKINAEGLGSAEHKILDLGYCGKQTYGVTGAMAFDSKGMKTDIFINSALSAETVSYEDFVCIVAARNDEIMKADAKEKRIEELKKQIKSMSDELNELLNN